MPRESATDRVAAFVAACPRQRVPVSEIEDHVAASDTALIGGNLAAVVLPALRTPAERDGLVLPAPGRGWDRWSDPSLPLWVQRAPRAARPRPVRPARVWPAALEPAAARLHARRPTRLGRPVPVCSGRRPRRTGG